MKTCAFTLILSGVAEITPDLADALYAATLGDVELNLRHGVAFLEFDRKASTPREAFRRLERRIVREGFAIQFIGVAARIGRESKSRGEITCKLSELP
jgi:hypothetical protein